LGEILIGNNTSLGYLVGPTWGFTNISLIEATLISLGIRCQLGKRCEREPRDSATFLLEAAFHFERSSLFPIVVAEQNLFLHIGEFSSRKYHLNEVFSSVPTGKRGKQL
jgi:hypothetical protein